MNAARSGSRAPHSTTPVAIAEGRCSIYRPRLEELDVRPCWRRPPRVEDVSRGAYDHVEIERVVRRDDDHSVGDFYLGFAEFDPIERNVALESVDFVDHVRICRVHVGAEGA